MDDSGHSGAPNLSHLHSNVTPKDPHSFQNPDQMARGPLPGVGTEDVLVQVPQSILNELKKVSKDNHKDAHKTCLEANYIVWQNYALNTYSTMPPFHRLPRQHNWKPLRPVKQLSERNWRYLS
jgi:hypothetical protein